MRYCVIIFFLTCGIVLTRVTGTPSCQHSTCSECIRKATCMWCGKNTNLTSDMMRCKSSESSEANEWRKECGSVNVREPENYYEILKDDDFSEGTAEGIIQLKPQRVAMDLRARDPYVMKVQYRHAKNYPTDLYYLMDGSKSMEDDQGMLSKLGKVLASSIKNITSDFQLGFGIFVEKTILPYITTVPYDDSTSGYCQATPYAFYNALPLTRNAEMFEDTVNKSKTECNVDMPESGLEALMQVMVCEKQIAWRDKSLRLIVLSTDAGFHYAGDGKLGGIVKPNDMQCHLDSDGLYTHYAFHDYPSISQIHHMAKERRANVIFAVTDKQKPLYSRLSEVIEGASYGIVEEDSSNIVPLLTEKVNDIISRVRLRHEPEQSVKIKYFSACKGNEKVETSTCDKLEPGDTVEFEIEVSVDKCSEDPIPPIHIYPEGRNESVTIELTMICKCKCEEPGDPGFIVNDDLCNKNGDNKCGICSCHKGYVGRHCECEVDSAYTDITSDNLCRMDNSSSVCSGRGMCVCGKCQCNKREPPQEIYGEFCQCTNYENCYDIASGRSCSGHGECKCSKCECNDGWTGPRCSCQDSQDKCIRPGTNKVCSRNGICECNQCQCNTTYTGKFCEDCPTCTNVCDELTPCVQCQTFKTGDLLAKECKKNCTAINIIMVKEIENSEKICSGHDDNDCRFLFTYAEIDGILEVKVQEVLECPTSINILTIVISVVALIVALGLASLIVWKVVTTIKDRREYAQFILHQDQAKWTEQDNPIFKQATTVTSNPMFGKND